MIRLFKKRYFKPGVYIHIRLSDEKDWGLIQDILNLIHEKHLFSLGPKTVGRGLYCAFHEKDDARQIKRLVEKWRKSRVAEIKKKKMGWNR